MSCLIGDIYCRSYGYIVSEHLPVLEEIKRERGEMVVKIPTFVISFSNATLEISQHTFRGIYIS